MAILILSAGFAIISNLVADVLYGVMDRESGTNSAGYG
jgi:ABC-type dipeptide/oligopeptide/nickel transport system permease component